MKVVLEINHREEQRIEELWQKKFGVRTPDMCEINHVLRLGNYRLCVNIDGTCYVGTFVSMFTDYATLDDIVHSVVLVTNEHTYIVVYKLNREVKSFEIVK